MNEEVWWSETATTDDLHGNPPYDVDEVVEHRLVAARNWLGTDRRVLDLGCGEGRTTRCFAERLGSRVTVHGVDISSANVHRAAAIAATNGATNTRWWHGDGRRLPSGLTGRFSFAYSITVFQHIPIGAVWGYLREIHDRLEDDGSFLFTISVGDEPPTFLNHQIDDPEAFAQDLAGLYGSVALDPFPDENGWTWIQAWK